MMLHDPAPGRHLPAGVKVGDRPQSCEEGVDQRKTGKNQENTPLERGIFSCCRAGGGRDHSSRV